MLGTDPPEPFSAMAVLELLGELGPEPGALLHMDDTAQTHTVEIACRLPLAAQLNPLDGEPREGSARPKALPVGHLSPQPQGCRRLLRLRRRGGPGWAGSPGLALPLGRPQGLGRRSEDGPSLLWPSTREPLRAWPQGQRARRRLLGGPS